MRPAAPGRIRKRVLFARKCNRRSRTAASQPIHWSRGAVFHAAPPPCDQRDPVGTHGRHIRDRFPNARRPAQVMVGLHQLPPPRLVACGDRPHDEVAQDRLGGQRHHGLGLDHGAPMRARYAARARQRHQAACRQPTQQGVAAPPIHGAVGAAPVPRPTERDRQRLARPVRMGRDHLLNLCDMRGGDRAPAAPQRRREERIGGRRPKRHARQPSKSAAKLPGRSASRSPDA